MVLWLFKQFRYLRSAAKSVDTPRQLAAGVALGMLLGIVPKGNLIAVFVSMLIFGTRVNAAAAMIAAVAFSLIAAYTDGLTHPIGNWLLAHPSLQTTWRKLYDVPLVPWTSFNNTVVLGSFVAGLALTAPSYQISLRLFTRWHLRRQAKAKLAEESAEQVVEQTVEQSVESGDEPAANDQPLMTSDSLASSVEPATHEVAVEHPESPDIANAAGTSAASIALPSTTIVRDRSAAA
ncbi:MAG: TIGR03546 family protein [Planctomycetales bacterium]|nr:TIGR03546 family protein [Planctomycetales bacterium]